MTDAPAASHWRDHVFATLAERGHRAGGARTAVVEALAAEGGCIEAEELEARLTEEGTDVGTASVYRALSLLTDLGLLQRVGVHDGPARFELVLPDGDHHHHLVCDRCGRTASFSDEPLEEAIDAVAKRSSFEVAAHEVTLRGLCSSCKRTG